MMKILIGRDIRQADLYTIENEPVTSIDLMERAAVAIEAGIAGQDSAGKHDYVIFAGPGNNGGDGLAVARLLFKRFGSGRTGAGCGISVVTVGHDKPLSQDCRTNLERLPGEVKVCDLKNLLCEPDDQGRRFVSLFGRNALVVDAILGTGVHGQVKGIVRSAVGLIDGLRRRGAVSKVISIDMPTGLPTEPEVSAAAVTESPAEPAACCAVTADETITVEFPKLSLLLPETGRFAGRVSVAHIGLHRDFLQSAVSEYAAVDAELIRTLMPSRGEFGHKGTFGHALVIAGSVGMMGAAVLSVGAALRSGCGLVTAHVPSEERHVIHVSHPSAIVSCDPSPVFSALPSDLGRYSAIAVGPGLGRRPESVAALKSLLAALSDGQETDGACRSRVLVLDADAINMISEHPEMFALIPRGSVLTPHVGELARLLSSALESGLIDICESAEGSRGRGCGHGAQAAVDGAYPWRDDMHKLRLARALAAGLSSVLVVKGAHTMICSPDGRVFFNMTGNPGMAKGGSGDVLTGLVAGLAARVRDPLGAALLGVWFHGAAGDRAARERCVESMNSSDILDSIRILPERQ